MILCHCARVTDRDVHAAIEDGARTLSSVCRVTSAAQDCGGCIFAVKATMQRHAVALDRSLPEVSRAAG